MKGRTDLSCRTARNWLQSPEGLAALDAWALTRHLEQCSTCRGYHESQRELDDRLRVTLEATAAGQSVRADVLHQLQAHAAATPARGGLFPRLLPHALSLAVAVTIGIVLALALPQILSHHGERTPGAIAWRVMYPAVGYPMTDDPRSPDHLLAGAEGQVYQSRDGGHSWHRLAPLPAGNVIRAVTIDRSNTSRYLVATKHSIFVSRDDGRHWTRAADSLPGAMNMFLIQGRSPNTFYVGPSVLWKSADRGHSWRPAGRGYVFAPDGIQALAAAPNGTLIAGIWAGGVAVSRDSGASWQRRMHGLARNVMDVAATSAREFWAGTDRGVYRTTDGGATWQARGLEHVRVTSLLVRPGFILAGGTASLYRSMDGGKTWQTITNGLPLRPYVGGFSFHPARPQRVYASLNTDAIFRSDDGGRTWVAARAGLPIGVIPSTTRTVLFLRDDYLWKTDSQGSDPGLLSVDSAVRAAAVSTDGVSAAYVTGQGDRWTARVLSAYGGSLAHDIAQGSGKTPTRLIWSPTSALLAIAGVDSITVSDLRGHQWRWSLRPSDHLVDWSASGQTLLFWDARTERLIERTSQGAMAGVRGSRYGGLPVLAPDHRHVALLDRGTLRTGTWGHMRTRKRVGASCRVISWSDDSTLLLLSCGARVEIRTTDGKLRRRIRAADDATWAPASHNVLFFRNGALRRWDARGERTLVSNAAPAGSTQ